MQSAEKNNSRLNERRMVCEKAVIVGKRESLFASQDSGRAVDQEAQFAQQNLPGQNSRDAPPFSSSDSSASIRQIRVATCMNTQYRCVDARFL
jgi:hypothetical protein